MEPFYAPSQMVCFPVEQMRRVLGVNHDEAPFLEGITAGGTGLFQVWRKAGGETWSATITFAREGYDKIGCLIIEGTDLSTVIWNLLGVPL